MSKFCTNCGREAADEINFCPACGKPFEQQNAAEEQSPYEAVSYEPQTSYEPKSYEPQTAYEPQSAYQPPYDPARPQYAQPQQGYQYPVKQKVPGRGFGIASMVLGIIAAVYGFILLFMTLGAKDVSTVTNSYSSAVGGMVNYGFSIALIVYAVFDGILALLALIFGIVSVVKKYKKQSIAGLIMGGISMVIVIFAIITAATMKKPSLSELSSYGKNYNNNYSSNYSDYLKDFNSILDGLDDYLD